jgi:dTDP-4-dehydrorhamnose reductase
MTMKILLLGKNGQVGWELQRALAPLGEVVARDLDDGLDLTDVQATAELVRRVRPQVVVNAAAHTAVDKAESEPELARRINADAPALLAAEAKVLGALLVHFSTDYVYDGGGNAPRDESAPTGPLSVYGATKLAGDEAIAASGCDHLILRTSWVYGARGGNFAKVMLKLAAEREQLKVIDDQFGAPTGADLLADLAAHMIVATRARPALSGVYHAVAGGETNWHGYARHVIEFARTRGTAIKVAPEQVLPIPTREYPTPAQRPLNSRLSTTKLQQAFGLTLPAWQHGVERMLTEIL